MSAIKPTIEHEGQAYVDEEVKVMPKIGAGSMGDAIAAAFGYIEPRREPIVVGHERVHLNWKKPARDAKGKIIFNADGSVKLIDR